MSALLTEMEVDHETERGTISPRDGGSMMDRVSMKSVSSTASIAEVARVFKLLSDETRLRILFLLQQSPELNVLELCKQLDQRQPSVSHHLALLRVAGLIAMRRDGKHNFYRVRHDRLQEIVATVFQGTQANPLRAALEDLEDFSPHSDFAGPEADANPID